MPGEEAAVFQAAGANILALTSACNLNCLFCSHKGNPPDIKVFRIRPRTQAEIATALDFVDPGRKVFIGESAGRIEEGEPFTHPQIKEILELIRRRLPHTCLSITTNATLWDENVLDWLPPLQPLELVVSLNCVGLAERREILGDRNPARVLKTIAKLKERGIRWHGSIVAMPHLIGWADLENTIDFCIGHNCSDVRIFLPGYTRWSPRTNAFDITMWDRLQVFVTAKRAQAKIPLLLEPPRCRDVTPIVAGVMPETPAFHAGMKTGDIIRSVSNRTPRSRAEAFFLCRNAPSPRLIVSREGRELELLLDKPPKAAPGFAVDRDMDPEAPQAVIGAVKRKRSIKPLLLTSTAALPAWEASRPVFGLPDNLKIVAVRNTFFGGSIITAGLLTVTDFQEALAEAGEHDLVIVPSLPFDTQGKDLTGRPWTDLNSCTESEIIILP